jgi:hypothetical protein
MTRQIELAAHIRVALEAHRLRRARRIQRDPRAVARRFGPARCETVWRLDLASRVRMQARRSVAGFAPGTQRIGPRSNQPRVVRRGKIPADLVMALLHSLEPIYQPAPGQHHHRTVHAAAGDCRRQQHERATASAASAAIRRFRAEGKLRSSCCLWFSSFLPSRCFTAQLPRTHSRPCQ